jgi:acetyl-CoA acyltransferase
MAVLIRAPSHVGGRSSLSFALALAQNGAVFRSGAAGALAAHVRVVEDISAAEVSAEDLTMREVMVLGVGMTRFGRHPDKGLKALGSDAVREALEDAGFGPKDLEAAFVGNAMAGLMTGQECIRGQVILRSMGLGGLPVYNMENACASASTAFHTGWMAIAGGIYDVVLALGVEKLYHEDKQKSFAALAGALDTELADEVVREFSEDLSAEAPTGTGERRSVFMDYYACEARKHMAQYGSQPEHFAMIAVKNHNNGSFNRRAQFQRQRTIEEVLSAPMIAEPLTRLMCSPIGDGAAAAILCSGERARGFRDRKPITVAASVLGSGTPVVARERSVVERSARQAYDMAGLGPEDLSLAEVHDAAASAEVVLYEQLGFCRPGEGGRLIADGVTTLRGRLPVNPSGGLLAKGHPVGATGVAQVVEVVEQLRGRAQERQVAHAKVALTENAGGAIEGEPAACAVHIFKI